VPGLNLEIVNVAAGDWPTLVEALAFIAPALHPLLNLDQ
jgi:hypothetical protein